jgi:adhesin transport system outer membrane protein
MRVRACLWGAAIFKGKFRSAVRAGAVAAVLGVACFAWPQGAGAVTLREELTGLLATHPRIQADQHTAEAARERVRQAFSAFLPKLAVSADGGYEHIDTPTRRIIGLDESSTPREKATVSLTQPLFDGFRMFEGHAAAKLRQEVAERNLEATRQTLILEGISAYYGVLRQSKLAEIAAANEQTIAQQLNLEDERVRRGAGISLDVLFAKARLQIAKERRVQLEGTLRETAARYAQLFGHAPNIAALAPPELKLADLPPSLDEANRTAIQNNPSLIASDRRVNVADREVGIAESDLFPKLDLVGQYNWEDNVDAVRGIRRDWSVLVKLSWELFSGFSTQAKVAAATLEKSAAFDSYNVNRRKVSEDLAIAWEQLMTARERAQLLDNAVAIAEEVFDSRRRLRDAGRETAINVLDAQSEVFNARLNYLAATYDAQLAVFRVLGAMGLLGPADLGL